MFYHPHKEVKILHKDITEAIIQAFYTVYNTLGYGFLEKVYENALLHELTKRGLDVLRQMPIKVYYDGVLVGEYFADLVVAGCVIVEIKAAESLRPEHAAQLLNYLLKKEDKNPCKSVASVRIRVPLADASTIW